MTGGVEGGAVESVAHCVLSGCSTNLLTIIFYVCFIRATARKLHHRVFPHAVAAPLVIAAI